MLLTSKMKVRFLRRAPFYGRQADISWLHLSRKQDRHRRGRSVTDAFRQPSPSAARMEKAARRSFSEGGLIQQPRLRPGKPTWTINEKGKMKAIRYLIGLFGFCCQPGKEISPPVADKNYAPAVESKASDDPPTAFSQDDSPPGYKIRWHH